jgi:predicted N-acyltransferase
MAMPDDAKSAEAVIQVVPAIAEIGRARWDACANPGWPGDMPLAAAGDGERSAYNPFIAYDFLQALEQSGTVGRRPGWVPQHLSIIEGEEVVAVAPAYLKSHSRGEYVFDHGWADAYERAGGSYYPKLQLAVPFTPVPGRRLLARPGPQAERHRKLLGLGAVELARRHDVSSVHATFLGEDEWRLLGDAGYLQRTGRQFHFLNEGYRDFDDFLAALTSRKRKSLRRERRDALEGGITIEHLTGKAITEADWDAFFAFYMDTGSRKWGTPYLNRKFFSLIGERMSDRILLVIARRNGKAIAGALNLIGSDALYGRYWGAIEEQPFLHFEVCYYQAIDWAIAHGIERVEAGAQGEHKLARGYAPQTTYSAHWIADAGFRRAVADFLQRERQQVAADDEVLAEYVPFRNESAS